MFRGYVVSCMFRPQSHSSTNLSSDSCSSAHWINPTWVALDKSRGIETETSKFFMRSTVVVWDLLVYVPALVMFVKTWQGNRSSRIQAGAKVRSPSYSVLTLLQRNLLF